MDQQKQRIAIAEACGWKCIQDSEYKPFGKPYKVGLNPDGSENLQVIPDYLNDLNAMHAAINALSHLQLSEYGKHLQNVTRCFIVGYIEGDYYGDLRSLARLSNATAAQRAEAFLKALNLWAE